MSLSNVLITRTYYFTDEEIKEKLGISSRERIITMQESRERMSKMELYIETQETSS